MENPDLEKTIKGLEICIENIDKVECPEECPYYEKCTAYDNRYALQPILRDTLALLKAQEPRVMTLTEAFDAEVAWLERYAEPEDGVEPIIQPVLIRYYENGYWQCLVEQDESADLSLFLDGFGTEFRFWTSRPSEEQWKAVKWE